MLHPRLALLYMLDPRLLPIVVKCACIGPNLWHPSLAACYNNVCRRRVVLLLEWINNALWKIYNK